VIGRKRNQIVMELGDGDVWGRGAGFVGFGAFG
jgi:hypothetical protein